MGSRLLKKWIEKPLVRQEAIEARLDRVTWLSDHFMERNAVRAGLSEIYDLQRLIARIAMNNAGPVDIVRLSKTLNQVPVVFSRLKSPEFVQYTSLDPLSELSGILNDAFADDPPAQITDGGVFRDGFHSRTGDPFVIQSFRIPSDDHRNSFFCIFYVPRPQSIIYIHTFIP